jgi:proline iminopeptidase
MKVKLFSLAFACISALLIAGCTKGRSISEEGNLVPETVDRDPSLPSILVNGTQLHSEAFGNPDSAMIVVLHGGPGADYRSLLNCKAFSDQGYRVVFYDQRGSGLSKRHPKDSYSLQVMYDDLRAVINHYRKSSNQKVFLLGHSWGAILATGFINNYPQEVNGAILAEPGGLVYDDIIAYIKRSRKVSLTSELANDVSYSDQFITGRKDEHAVLDYKYALLSAADGAKDNPTGNEGRPTFWRFGKVVADALIEIGDRDKPNFTTNLDQYTIKILFVYSENNRAYGLPYAEKVSAPFPNVQLEKIEDAGHDILAFPRGWNNFYPLALAYFNSLK